MSLIRLSLRVPFAYDLHRSILVQQTHSDVTRLVDQTLDFVTCGNFVQSGGFQVFREPVVAEVALLQRRAALEDQSIAKRRHLADAGQNPGQEIVTFKHLPGNGETSTRFLETRAERSHPSPEGSPGPSSGCCSAPFAVRWGRASGSP